MKNPRVLRVVKISTTSFQTIFHLTQFFQKITQVVILEKMLWNILAHILTEVRIPLKKITVAYLRYVKKSHFVLTVVPDRLLLSGIHIIKWTVNENQLKKLQGTSYCCSLYKISLTLNKIQYYLLQKGIQLCSLDHFIFWF